MRKTSSRVAILSMKRVKKSCLHGEFTATQQCQFAGVEAKNPPAGVGYSCRRNNGSDYLTLVLSLILLEAGVLLVAGISTTPSVIVTGASSVTMVTSPVLSPFLIMPLPVRNFASTSFAQALMVKSVGAGSSNSTVTLVSPFLLISTSLS